MSDLAKKVPYAGSKLSVSDSKAKVEAMLKEFGAKALRWTETPASMEGKECPILEFILETEMKGMKKQFGIRIQPPLMLEKKRRYGRYGETVRTPNANASMRLLYWYLKARMEAVLFGLDDVVETFMSKIMMNLPDGSVSTMGKVVQEQPHLLTELLPSFEIKPRLTDKHAEVIDVDVLDESAS